MAKKAQVTQPKSQTFGEALGGSPEMDEAEELDTEEELEDESEGESEEESEEGDEESESEEGEESDEDDEPEDEDIKEEEEGDEDDESESEESEEKSEEEGEKAASTQESSETKGQTEERNVPLEALLDERKKRHAAEKKLKELTGEGGETTQETEGAPHVSDEVLAISVRAARKLYPDYSEKYAAVVEAASQKGNEWIMDSLMRSKDPGQQCYEMGEEFLFQKKYGNTRGDQVKNLRTEIEKELRPKIEAEIQAKLQEKLRKKNKTPTDISKAKASKGNGSAAPKGRTSSFGQRLSR